MSEPWLLARWRTWPRGDYGLTDPVAAPASAFSGKNVVVTQSGALMKRGGLLALNPTELTRQPVWHHDIVRGLGRFGDDYIWYLQEQSGAHTVVRRFRLRDSSTGYITGATASDYTMTNNITSLSTRAYATCNDGETITYLAVGGGGGVYKIDHGASPPTCTLLGFAPGGAYAIALFGDNLVLGGTDGVTNRIRWSAPEDFTHWPSVNFLDVGRPGETIRGLYVVGNVIYAVMEEGTIYHIAGTLGVNEVVRQFNAYGDHTAGIAFQGAGVVTRDNVLWATRGSHNTSYNFAGGDFITAFQVPYAIAGPKRVEHPELDQWVYGISTDQEASSVYAIRLAGLDDVAFCSGPHVWAFINGAWTKHEFPDLTPNQSLWASAYYGHVVVFDPNTTPSRWFVLNLAPQTVDAVLFDEYAPLDLFVAGDGNEIDSEILTTPIGFPTGREIRCDAVVVNFRRGPISGRNNTLSVSLVCYDIEDGSDGPVVVDAVSFERLPGDGTTSVAYKFEFQSPDCRKVAVQLSGLDGVMIDEVRAIGTLIGPIRYGPISEP